MHSKFHARAPNVNDGVVMAFGTVVGERLISVADGKAMSMGGLMANAGVDGHVVVGSLVIGVFAGVAVSVDCSWGSVVILRN